MSAVFGVINKKGKPVDSSLLNKMKAALAHRDTGHTSTWCNDNAGLGCASLVVYPGNAGEQLPFQKGDLVIVASLQLHHANDLARKLYPREKIEVIPDAQLVLSAYEKWGKDCVNHLDGEYVFVIWDKLKDELFIAADHLGHKCFYYHDSPEAFIFCSEIKGIEAVKSSPNYFDEYVLIKRILRETCPADTYNKEIKRLVGGHCISLKDDTMHLQRYWTLARQYKYSFSKDQDWYDCLRDLVYRSIEKRMHTDGRIGIKLSGGLDSSVITCILSELLAKKNKPLYAFSSVSSIASVEDEKKYIGIVMDHCPNVILHTEDAEGLHPLHNVEKSVNQWEFYSHLTLFMYLRLLEAAQTQKISVMYSGWGGDQWVSSKGNAVVYEIVKEGKWNEAFRLMKQMSEAEKHSLLSIIKKEIISKTLPAKLYRQARGKVSAERFTFAQHRLRQKYQAAYRERSPLTQYDFINKGLMSCTLQREDHLKSRHGMIAATPLADKSVLEFMSDVPLRLFIEGGHGRSLFRKSFEPVLPNKIANRLGKKGLVTDAPQRMRDRVECLEEILRNPEMELFYNRYVSKRKVENSLYSYTKPNSKAGDFELMRLTDLALIMESFLIFKKNKGYFLDY